jgi:hypothetical protein
LGEAKTTKMKDEIKTTNEIFQESMKLSDLAWKEKGEKLKEYQEWLKKKWISIEEAEKIIKGIKDDCKEENTRYKRGWDDALNLLALEIDKDDK